MARFCRVRSKVSKEPAVRREIPFPGVGEVKPRLKSTVPASTNRTPGRSRRRFAEDFEGAAVLDDSAMVRMPITCPI